MAVKLTEIYVLLTARERGLNKALTDVHNSARRASNAIDEMALRARRALTIIGGLATINVMQFAQFERTMSNVKAAMLTTDDQMEKMAQAAREVGKTTVFGATEAAKAMLQLAKAGFTAEEILATLKPTLDLAASSELDMGTVTGILISVLKGMSLQIHDVTKVVDNLAMADDAAWTSVRELGEAMAKLGPIGELAGQKLTHLLAALDLMAQRGIKGSEAGTQIRSSLLRLTGDSTTVRRGLDYLKLTVRDLFQVDGRMKELPELVDMFAGKMGEVDVVTRKAALALIFGLRNAAAWTVLLEEGGDSLDKLANKIDTGGAAAAKAEIRLQNLWGQGRLLLATFQELSIQIGTILEPAMSRMLKIVRTGIERFNTLRDSAKDTIIQIAALSAAALGFLVSFKAVSFVLLFVAKPLTLLVSLLGALAAVLVANTLQGDTFGEKMQDLVTKMTSFGKILKDSVLSALEKLVFGLAAIAALAENAGDAIEYMKQRLDIIASKSVDTLINKVTKGILRLKAGAADALLSVLEKEVGYREFSEDFKDTFGGPKIPAHLSPDEAAQFIKPYFDELEKKPKKILKFKLADWIHPRHIDSLREYVETQLKAIDVVNSPGWGAQTGRIERLKTSSEKLKEKLAQAIAEVHKVFGERIGLFENVTGPFEKAKDKVEEIKNKAGEIANKFEKIPDFLAAAKKEIAEITFVGLDEAFRRVQEAIGKPDEKMLQTAQAHLSATERGNKMLRDIRQELHDGLGSVVEAEE